MSTTEIPLPASAQQLNEDETWEKLKGMGNEMAFLRNVAWGIPGESPNIFFPNPQDKENYVAALEKRRPRDVASSISVNKEWPLFRENG